MKKKIAELKIFYIYITYIYTYMFLHYIYLFLNNNHLLLKNVMKSYHRLELDFLHLPFQLQTLFIDHMPKDEKISLYTCFCKKFLFIFYFENVKLYDIYTVFRNQISHCHLVFLLQFDAVFTDILLNHDFLPDNLIWMYSLAGQIVRPRLPKKSLGVLEPLSS